jgi:hypothetical protein
MKVTRQLAAEKIADYLHGKVSQAELVDWSERAMMDAEFDDADTEILSEIIGRLGLADVAEFGLRWQAFGCRPNFTEGGAERERMRLGNPGNRDLGVSISDCEEFLRRLGYRATVTVSTA